MGKSVIVDDMEHCYVCGSPYVQIHHIIGGTANRKISDFYGFVVPLCMEHHTGSRGVHFNKPLDLHLKKLAQKHFEGEFGARNEFIKVFGKSYL
jgi:hypothetical protein